MPIWFRAYLESLSPDKATVLWDWLDHDPDAIHQMIVATIKATGYQPNPTPTAHKYNRIRANSR